MKRCVICFAALLLLLTACSGTREGLRFYYRDAPDGDGHLPFGTSDGAIGFELRDYHPRTFGALFSLYFAPPVDSSLESPFPKGLTCRSVTVAERVLTVTLSPEFDELSVVERNIAEACLVRTLTQFEGVDGVRILTAEGQDAPVLCERDFVLEDLGAVNIETAVRLYFSDSSGRCLVPTERKQYFAGEEQIPAFVVSQLIDGPDRQDQLAVIPEGAALRSVTVDGGLCTVDFSSEFLLNKPASDLAERLTIFAIVDSLTELPQIERVRFLVEGEAVGIYRRMDLSEPLSRDESVFDADGGEE